MKPVPFCVVVQIMSPSQVPWMMECILHLLDRALHCTTLSCCEGGGTAGMCQSLSARSVLILRIVAQTHTLIVSVPGIQPYSQQDSDVDLHSETSGTSSLVALAIATWCPLTVQIGSQCPGARTGAIAH